jgi:hypothetical protein
VIEARSVDNRWRGAVIIAEAPQFGVENRLLLLSREAAEDQASDYPGYIPAIIKAEELRHETHDSCRCDICPCCGQCRE